MPDFNSSPIKTSFNSEVDSNFNDRTFGIGFFLRNEFTQEIEAIGDYTNQVTRYRTFIDEIASIEAIEQDINPREIWIKNFFMNHVVDTAGQNINIDEYGNAARLTKGIKMQYSFDGQTIIDLFDFSEIRDYGEIYIQNFDFRNREFGRSGTRVFASQIIFDAVADTGTYLKFDVGVGAFLQIVLNDDMSNRDFIHHNFRCRGLALT